MSAQSAVQAGMASRVINPAEGLPLVGYPSERPNTGIGLDLCARAVVFAAPDADAPQAALVVLDTIGVGEEIREAVRERAAALIPGMDGAALLVAATHTHSAPPLVGFTRKDGTKRTVDPEYRAAVIEGAAGAVADAWAARLPVTLRFGMTEAHLGHNRRVVDEEGKATNEWLDDGTHSGYFVPDVPFIVLDDAESGRPAGVIVSYGCHPVTLGPPNFKVSPDYPGYLVRKLEALTGVPTAMFVQGGGANINPKNCLNEEPTETECMGHVLAEKVADALDTAEPIALGPVVSASAELSLLIAETAREKNKDRAEASLDGRHLITEVQALAVGDLAFVSAPGELFAEIAQSMRDASPFPRTIAVGYGDDTIGYLYTDKAREEGGYEPSNGVSDHVEEPLVAAARAALEVARAAM